MAIYTHAAALIAGLAIGFGGAWQTQTWRYGAIEAKRLTALTEAEKKRDKYSYDASVKFEKEKARVETIFQTITETVEVIIDRPVYRNVCYDADGLRALQRAIGETASSQPSSTLPATP